MKKMIVDVCAMWAALTVCFASDLYATTVFCFLLTVNVVVVLFFFCTAVLAKAASSSPSPLDHLCSAEVFSSHKYPRVKDLHGSLAKVLLQTPPSSPTHFTT